MTKLNSLNMKRVLNMAKLKKNPLAIKSGDELSSGRMTINNITIVDKFTYRLKLIEEAIKLMDQGYIVEISKNLDDEYYYIDIKGTMTSYSLHIEHENFDELIKILLDERR